MELEFVDPRCDSDWDSMVLLHSDYSFFHSTAWAKALCKSYGHKPVYLRWSERGEPVALVSMMDVRSPLTGRRGVGLPFTDFCVPLMFGKRSSAFVIEKLSELARERNWKHFEIRGGTTFGASVKPAVTFYGHTLDLRRETDDLLNQFKGSVRSAIRKAQRAGLEVQVCRSREAILQYYRLHVQTRRRHGLPPQPLSFFLNIHDEIIKPGLGFVVMASSGSRPAAANIFFQFGKKAVYKSGASIKRLQELRASNLVMWEGIRFLAQNGAETLHFGRTSLENEGLRRFKLTWGTEEEAIDYLKFDTATQTWVTGRDAASGFHGALFSRLPLALNCLAGAIIYPHLD